MSGSKSKEQLQKEAKYLRERVTLLARAVYYEAKPAAAVIPWAGPWGQWTKVGEKEYYAEQGFPVDQVLVREPSVG